jgi:hypothetical protein
MPDTSVTLIVAAILFGVALAAFLIGRALGRRLGALGEGLRTADARIVHETGVLAAWMVLERTDLAAVSTATERALWSLSRFDERLDAARAGLAARRVATEEDRARLIGARTTIIRVKKSAQMVMKVLELRRAILG